MHTPDLFDGRTFAAIGAGMTFVEETGFEEILDRGVRAVDGLPEALVYAGFSLGVMPAQKLAQTRPGARGAVLMSSCVPAATFGAWPRELPAQIHGMDTDPYFAGEGDVDAAREIVAGAESVELFLYRGDQHCFADRTLPSYVPAAADLLMTRVKGFLAER